MQVIVDYCAILIRDVSIPYWRNHITKMISYPINPKFVQEIRAGTVVLANETKKPLSGVAFSLTNPTNNGEVKPNNFSDSLGHFEFDHFVGSGLEGFETVTMHFTKTGYNPVTVTFKNGSENDTILLQKTQL